MFGGEDYAREELVAEMGSAMLCMGAGIEGKALDEGLENSASYLQSWLKAIKEAKDGGAKFINSSASKAQRACELLMPDVFGFKEEDKKEEE
jgi:antirestriction protein ArdC